MPTNETLHQIGLKHGTDKSTYHMYMDVYERHIDRSKTTSLLEIGVQAGFSLRAWREWLNDSAIVDGWDIVKTPEIEGCNISIVDQSSREQMDAAVPRTGYSVIIDDGGHTPLLMETSFSFLFRFCTIYIIEDLHAWWLGYREQVDKIPTVELLRLIGERGWLSSYATKEESEYISRNAKVEEIFFRGEEDNPESMTAVIYNMERINA